MDKQKIIIDPGHGGKDPGTGNCYFKEKGLALKISLYQKKRFEQLGFVVKMTRDKDITLTSGQRAQRVKNSGAEYCISNHINAGGGEGAEVIHSIYNDGKLASKILDELVRAGAKRRKIFCKSLPKNKRRDFYFMHRETGNVVTNIVEYGFADNKSDTEKLLKDWEDYAEAVIRAMCYHTGMKYEPIKTPVKSIKEGVPQWKQEGAKYLVDAGITTELHNPLESVDIGTLGVILKNLQKGMK